MKTKLLLDWLLSDMPVIGAEGEGAGEGEDHSQDGSQEGQENSSEDDEGDTSDDDEDAPDDLAGLRSALAAERKLNKQKERELKSIARRDAQAQKQKDADELKEKSELEQERIKREQAEEKTTKLAAGLRNSAVRAAIKEAAEKSNFIDPADAIDGVDWESLEVEQDEDDPSIVTIDPKKVLSQVKALALKKPHYVKAGTSDGEPSGSQFGGGRKSTDKLSDEKLKEQYPSLR